VIESLALVPMDELMESVLLCVLLSRGMDGIDSLGACSELYEFIDESSSE